MNTYNKGVRRKKINCFQCQHYYVTWNKMSPHGCKAFGFKSREFPSTAVYKSSGSDCLMFKDKG